MRCDRYCILFQALCHNKLRPSAVVCYVHNALKSHAISFTYRAGRRSCFATLFSSVGCLCALFLVPIVGFGHETDNSHSISLLEAIGLWTLIDWRRFGYLMWLSLTTNFRCARPVFCLRIPLLVQLLILHAFFFYIFGYGENNTCFNMKFCSPESVSAKQALWCWKPALQLTNRPWATVIQDMWWK